MNGEPITPLVVLSATYAFAASDDLIDVVRNRNGYIYSRWDNPTAREAERALAIIEGVDILATQPVTNTHASMSAEERKAAGIPDNLVRLSVGLEPPEEIIADLEQALTVI